MTKWFQYHKVNELSPLEITKRELSTRLRLARKELDEIQLVKSSHAIRASEGDPHAACEYRNAVACIEPINEKVSMLNAAMEAIDLEIKAEVAKKEAERAAKREARRQRIIDLEVAEKTPMYSATIEKLKKRGEHGQAGRWAHALRKLRRQTEERIK